MFYGSYTKTNMSRPGRSSDMFGLSTNRINSNSKLKLPNHAALTLHGRRSRPSSGPPRLAWPLVKHVEQTANTSARTATGGTKRPTMVSRTIVLTRDLELAAYYTE